MSYKETESPFEGRVRMYLSRTCSVEIEIYSDGEDGTLMEIFRCNLAPIYTFIKQRLKNVDWEHISRTRDKKWGYKRIEAEELFDMLNDRRDYDDNR